MSTSAALHVPTNSTPRSSFKQTRYNFEAIFDIEETRALFKQFLKHEKNEEPLLFIEKIEHYLILKSNSSRYDLAKEIVHTFFTNDMLNVSNGNKKLVMEQFQTMSEDNCERGLFQSAYQQIMLELKIDVFSRFVKSDLFVSYIEKKKHQDANFVKRLAKEEQLTGEQASFILSIQQVYHSRHNESEDSSHYIPQHQQQGLDSEKPIILHLTKKQVLELLFEMSRPYTGVPLRDHKKTMFKTYTKCFTASDMLTWLCSYAKLESRQDATKIATYYLEQKHIVQLNTKKIITSVIDSDVHFFRFAQKKRVVIVGGGFAGIDCYKGLRDDFEVTLIDRTLNFEYILDFHTLVADPSAINNLTLKYSKLLKNTKFVHSDVKEITPEHVIVEEEILEKAQVKTVPTNIPYDYLVMATGSTQFIPFPVDSISKECCVSPYESKSILDKFNKLREAHKIVVIGGGALGMNIGYSYISQGIELVGELATSFKEAQIYLIAQRSIFLERQCEDAHKSVTKVLNKFPNLKVITSRQVVKIENKVITYRLISDDAVLKNLASQAPDEHLQADVFITCTGKVPRTNMFEKHFTNALVTKYKFVEVNDKFQVLKTAQSTSTPSTFYRNIFAIGDICAIDEEKLAQVACLHGQVVAKNIKRLESSASDKEMVIYKPEPRIQIISIGPNHAILVKGDKVYMDGVLSAKFKQMYRHKKMFDIKS